MFCRPVCHPLCQKGDFSVPPVLSCFGDPTMAPSCRCAPLRVFYRYRMIRATDDSRTRWFAQIVIYYNFIIEFIRPCVYLRSSAIANFCSPCLKRRNFSTVCRPTLVGVCYPISYITTIALLLEVDRHLKIDFRQFSHPNNPSEED